LNCADCGHFDGSHCSVWGEVVPEDHRSSGCDRGERHATFVIRKLWEAKNFQELVDVTWGIDPTRLTPDEFDSAWAAYVSRAATFRKRGERFPALKYEEDPPC